MDNKISVFEDAEFGTVRTMMINDEPWFVGKDVATILGYSNCNRDIVRHVDEEDRKNVDNGTQYRYGIELGQRGGWIINESGLYSLILSSKLPKAKEFKRWVTAEVLPSIRNNGVYATPEFLQKSISDPRWAMGVLQSLAEAQDKIEAQQKQIAALKPKATYYDLVLQTKNAVNITTIAKDYGLSAVALNKKLHEYGVQYKQGGTWLLYQKYADMGYTKSATGVYTNNAGEEYATVHTRWTQKGRLFIYEILKEHGILPKVEAEEENSENVIQFSVV